MYTIYKLENEKNLEEVANKFGITVSRLKEINGITDNYIVEEGNFIIVPKKENSNFSNYKVKNGDTIYEIAKKYNVPYKDLLDLNGLEKDEYIYADQIILVPDKDVKFKITMANDTLEKIAQMLEANVDELIKQNKTILLEPNQLIVYKKRV